MKTAAAVLTGEPMQCSDATADQINARISTLEAENKSLRREQALRAVAVATQRGALAAKDADSAAKWLALIEADPTNETLLASLPANPALATYVPNPGARGLRRHSCEVGIVTESFNDAAHGYLSAASSIERGMIYQKEFDPLLAKLGPYENLPFRNLQLRPVVIDGVPMAAANALGTLVGNLISQRTLSLIVSRRPLLRQVVTDFSPEQARLNQTVYTRTTALPTVQNFGTAPTDTADTDYPVVLNLHKEVRFAYTAAEYNSTGRNLVNEHSEALALALGNYMVDTVAALITAAFTSVQVGASNTSDYARLVSATKTLNVAGVPDMDRFAWVNSDVAEALRNDELVMANFSRDGGAYAQWKNVEGFNEITEYPALPVNAINLIAFLFMKAALLVASRISQDPAQLIGAGYPGRLQTVTDPVTGLSVVSNQYIVQDTLAINDRLILLFGCARGIVAAGHRWASA